MKELQFESIYKFIVSIGIAIFLLPIGILTLIFRDDKILYIKNDDLLKLTETSQNIIKIKQSTMLNSINSIGFFIFFLVLLLIGFGVIIYGLYKWNKVQKQIDRKSSLENIKLESEIEQMTEKEKYASIKQEISNDNIKTMDTKTGSKLISYVREYYNIEGRVASVIRKKCSSNHYILTNAKIRGHEYDVIARGKGPLDRDYIFEIKYVSSLINDEWLSKVARKVTSSCRNYSINTKRIPYRKLVIVTDQENFEKVKSIVTSHDKMNKFSIDVILKDSIDEYFPNI